MSDESAAVAEGNTLDLAAKHPELFNCPSIPTVNRILAEIEAEVARLRAHLATANAPNDERPTRDQLAEAFIRGFQAGAERPQDAGDGDEMYQAFRDWRDR